MKMTPFKVENILLSVILLSFNCSESWAQRSLDFALHEVFKHKISGLLLNIDPSCTGACPIEISIPDVSKIQTIIVDTVDLQHASQQQVSIISECESQITTQLFLFEPKTLLMIEEQHMTLEPTCSDHGEFVNSTVFRWDAKTNAKIVVTVERTGGMCAGNCPDQALFSYVPEHIEFNPVKFGLPSTTRDQSGLQSKAPSNSEDSPK